MESTDLHPGLAVGRYVLQEIVGKGGFGEVWRAHKLGAPGKSFALKFALDPLYVRFLKKEGVIQHTLDHPGIVKTHEVHTEHDPPYVVMEFVQGYSLRHKLRESGPFKVKHAENLLFQLLEILEYTHDRGVVHRDLKPENILIEKGTGRVKLTDFGLGHVTGRYLSELMLSRGLLSGSAPSIAGTFAYQAPEARNGEEVDKKADLYAMAVVLFEVMTGRLPAGLELPSQRRRGVPRRFDRAFKLCFIADPKNRVASARAMRGALMRTFAERVAPLAAASLLLLPALALPLTSKRPAPLSTPTEAAPSVILASVEAPTLRAPATGEAFDPQVPLSVFTPRSPHESLFGARAWVERGRRHEAANHLDRALVCYEAALEEDPAHPEAARALARVVTGRRGRAEARSALLPAARLHREYLKLRAGASPGVPRYYAVSLGAEARRLYQQGLSVGPNEEASAELAALTGLLQNERVGLIRSGAQAEAAGRLREAHASVALALGVSFDPAAVAEAERELDRLALAIERAEAPPPAPRARAPRAPAAQQVRDRAPAQQVIDGLAAARRKGLEAFMGARLEAIGRSGGFGIFSRSLREAGRAYGRARSGATRPALRPPSPAEAPEEPLRLRSSRGYHRTTDGGGVTFVSSGVIVSLADLRDVKISIRFLAQDHVVDARTIQVPTLRAYHPQPFRAEVHESGRVAEITSHEVVCIYRDRRGVVHRITPGAGRAGGRGGGAE